VVRRVMELHGGSASGRSEGVGRGSEFILKLPLGAPPAIPRISRLPPTIPDRQLILIIEDNIDAAQTLAEVLEAGGYRVRIALDGRSGIAAARELAPEIVLCDIGLPDLDGYAVAQELRADEALRPTRLIALTGYAQPEDRAHALEAGFDAHIPKPASPDALLAVLAREGVPERQQRLEALGPLV